MPLTIKEIEAAAARPKKYKLYDEDGLFLQVMPNGRKYWRFKYTRNGRERELALGTFPEVTLKEVRERRDQQRRLLAQGIEPVEHRREQKAQRSILFRDVAEEWREKNAHAFDEPTRKKHAWILDTYLNPKLGMRPIGEIDTKDLLAVLNAIEEDGKHETAHRVRAFASRLFCYAVATDRAKQDPAWPLRHALAPIVVTHHAAITDPAKIGELLLAMDGYIGKPVTYRALQLAPLLMVRPGELRFAEWSEFDLEAAEWRIPAERMKMRALHIVPLARQALEHLKRLREITGRGSGKYLFPSERDADGVLSNNTIGKALRNLGYSSDVMTAHGFRSMASTRLNEMCRWNKDAIERQLAHAERDKVRAAYNYAEYLPERRQMMQAWADYLDELRAAAQKKPKTTKRARTTAQE